MKRVCAIVLLCGAAGAAWSRPPDASSCRLSGHRIHFSGTNCLGGNCSSFNQDITLTARKVLWSYDENPRGIAFTLGQTIDLFTDPDNDHTLPPAPPGLSQNAYATASFIGDTLSLDIHRQAIDRRGTVVSNYFHDIVIRFGTCRSCSVTRWQQHGNVYANPVTSSFTPGSCTVI